MNIGTVNFLNKLKNASVKNEQATTVTSNSLTRRIIKFLYKEGFILNFKIQKKVTLRNDSTETRIILKSRHEKACFSDLRIISTPAHQKFVRFDVLNRVSGKKTLFVFSTNRGLLPLTKCKRYHTGGVLLFVC